MKIADLELLQSVGRPTVAPDGSRAVVEVSHPSFEADSNVGQLWEVTAALLFFIAPIMYPITVLPLWAQRLVELNPFVQVLQDVRSILLGSSTAAADGITPAVDNRLLPIAIAAALVAGALLLYRREAPRFAERA